MRTLLRFAMRRGRGATNPAAAVEVTCCRRAGRLDPDPCCLRALRYFAGVRSAEARRLVKPATLAVFKKRRRFTMVSEMNPSAAWEGKLNVFSQLEFE